MNKQKITALVVGSGLAIAGGVFAGTAFAGPGCDKAEGKGERGADSRFSQLDTNKDGKVSLAELTASRESWLTRVDTNKDGVASQAEIDASFQAGKKEHLEKMFTREDANKDGRLTRDETRIPSAWFERADTNKNGALTLAEATEARKNAGPRKHGAPGNEQGKVNPIDQNGDGKVEKQELQNAAARQFARLDQNGDGNLTSDEFRRSHGRGHGRHRRGGDGQDTPAPAKPPAPVRG